jgi:hypothetical protein
MVMSAGRGEAGWRFSDSTYHFMQVTAQVNRLPPRVPNIIVAQVGE